MTSGVTVGRLRASAGLVAAVTVMMLVACTLVALVPIYSTAIVDAGLRATVLDADATDRTIDATVRAPAEDVEAVFGAADELLGDDTGAFDVAVFAESATYRFDTPPLELDPASGATIITSLAAFAGDDVFHSAPETSGDLGDLDRSTDADQPWAAAVHVDAADEFGLEVGDDLVVVPAGAAGQPVALELVALVEPVDAADPRWFGAPFGRSGLVASGSFVEVGPFFVSPEHFASVSGDATFTARLALRPAAVSPDTIDDLVATAGAADDSVGAALAPYRARVSSQLDTLLSDTDTSLRSTSAVVAAILLQLTAVAMYGLGVAAAVLVASRRNERVLLFSRGISTQRVTRDAVAEATVMVVPAVVFAPLVAVVAVRAVGSAGPLATTGLELRPSASPIAFALSLLVGAIGVGVIAWPAISAARARVADTRNSATPFLRRSGLDIVLFVAAVLGLWQLHRTGSVATSSSPSGRASIDPVLVVAPTLGVAAAALLAVRSLGWMAGLLERVGVRSTRLAPALAGREAARQGARRDRSLLLVVVAVAVATFALVHAVSWQRSQQDQADAAVGADITVTPDLRPDAGVAADALAGQYLAIDGVDGVAPLADRSVAISSTLGAVPLVGVDAPRFHDVSRLRSDVGPTDEQLEALSAVPDLDGVELPVAGGPLSAEVSLDASTRDASGADAPASASVSLALIVMDEFGVVHRLEALDPIDTEPADSPWSGTIGFEATPPATMGVTRLVEVEATVDLPFVDPLQEFDRDGDGIDDSTLFDLPGTTIDVSVDSLRVGGATLDLSPIDWTAEIPTPGRATVTPLTATVSATTATFTMQIDTGTTVQRSATAPVRFLANPSIDPIQDQIAIPVVASPLLTDELGLADGATTAARIGALRVPLRVIGTTTEVPFATDDDLALLADHATLATIEYLSTGTRLQPDRWALTVDAGLHSAVSATLRAAPFVSPTVGDRWAVAEQRTRDPVLVGLTGSLLLSVAAVAVVTLVGLVMGAVTGARDRRTAHGVLRALGAPRRELRRWLTRETVPLGILAATIGAVAGIAVAALVLGSLAGDRDGSPAVPPPVLVVPWAAVATAVGLAIVAVVLLPLATSRLLRGVRPADELRVGAPQ